MLRLLLAIPAVIFSLVWSAFFPGQTRSAPAAPLPVPDPDAPSAESQEAGHEVSDASGITMLLFVAGLFTVIVGTMVALGWMYSHLYTTAPAIPVPHLQTDFQHAPSAKTSIAKDWEKLDAQTRGHLEQYGWVEPARGIVRVPINQAMQLITKEGLPARTAQTPYFPPPDQEKLPLMELEPNPNALSFDPHP